MPKNNKANINMKTYLVINLGKSITSGRKLVFRARTPKEAAIKGAKYGFNIMTVKHIFHNAYKIHKVINH